ncbi:MAG: hypothetical protein LQ342_006394 [Letrouitia transgressa]|nr:MAG: hypothetical protein LQ342_006394 [Letrouitia transgressa]
MLNPARKLLKNWKSTLFLPKSSLPPRPLVRDIPKYLKRCTDDLYSWQRDSRKSSKAFCLHDGPPYANGPLHIGHALNKILKDITCRFQLLEGRRVDFVPGWDCHGLPIELEALKQLKRDGAVGKVEQAPPARIRQTARHLAQRTVEKQMASFRRWGIMADWHNAWKTMDSGFEIRQLNVFREMVQAGLIYRRYKPVYWSPSSKTALAEAELEYKADHLSTAAYVKFPMRIPLKEKLTTVNAVIWTTTPWTLSANRAIAVNPELLYLVLDSKIHGLLLVASSRREEFQKLCQEDLPILDQFDGSSLVGTRYCDPLWDPGSDLRPVLPGIFVSSESGSGIVHLAPGHGVEDYQLCLDHHISAYAPVDDEGRFTYAASPGDPQLLAGKSVLGEGSNAVLELLRRKELLIHRHQHQHTYPYDWRSKLPVIIRATEQWFADVTKIQNLALESLDQVQFIPLNSQERLRSFVKDRSEWCISRQRAWGIPIPALYNVESGEAIMTPEVVDHIIDVVRRRGTDAWWHDDESEPEWILPALRTDDSQHQYRRGKDTMDVWFDSGTSWTAMANEDSAEKLPVADVCLEGSDQHRGWFQSSLLTRVALQTASGRDKCINAAPFKTLVTHGFTLDSTGRKMSKSLGNVVSPDQIMEGTLLRPLKNGAYDAMGPDALRLWVASCDFTSDIRVSEEALEAVNSALSKYRVTFKFLLGVLSDFDPVTYVGTTDSTKFSIASRIALIQLREVCQRVHQHYTTLEYSKAIIEINKYINTNLSGLYIEISKDALYAGSSAVRKEMQLVFFLILRCLQSMLGPSTPLLVEETWDHTPQNVKNHLEHPFRAQWSQFGRPEFQDAALEEQMPLLLSTGAAIKRAQEVARRNGNMGSSLECFVTIQVRDLDTDASRFAMEAFERHHRDLETLFVISKVNLCVGPPPPTILAAKWHQASRLQFRGEDITVWIYKPEKAKCARCWRYAAPLEAKMEEALCGRCKDVLDELERHNPGLFEPAEPTIGVAPAA